jgi:hypothetical protein
LETAPNGAVTGASKFQAAAFSPHDHYLCDLSSALEVVLNLRILLFNACELTMAPDDLSRQHPPTSPAAPSLATRLGSVPSPPTLSPKRKKLTSTWQQRGYSMEVLRRATTCRQITVQNSAGLNHGQVNSFSSFFFFYFFSLLSIRIASHCFLFCMISSEL